ncbi:hypothetical protein, partial [Escherichia coli]|uniref:hypothetical protein n=1 Tax=Escherichia coli TaxID=562 RepID=UPI001319DD8C
IGAFEKTSAMPEDFYIILFEILEANFIDGLSINFSNQNAIKNDTNIDMVDKIKNLTIDMSELALNL